MKNIFDSIPADLPEEKFDELIKAEHIKIERIVSRGHATPGDDWYDQQKNEWVIVLKGEAVLAFEDQPSVTLRAGDYLDIPAHKKHRVERTAAAIDTVWLAVHY